MQGKIKYSNITNMLMLIYIDNGAIVFEKREDIEKGANVIYTTSKNIGLTIHIDNDNHNSKTEVIFYLPTTTL